MKHKFKKIIWEEEHVEEQVIWGDEDEKSKKKITTKTKTIYFKRLIYTCEKCGYKWKTCSQKPKLYCLKCNHEVPDEARIALRGW